MSKNEIQKIIELPYTEKNIRAFKLKKYWAVTVNGKILSNNGSPVLWHKKIDIKERLGGMMQEALYSSKEIGYIRADKMLKIIHKLDVKFNSIIVYGKVENGKY